MKNSETLGELAKALAAVQGEIENASKNAQNPHFRSTYADLAEIINTVRPVLSRHGLSVVQLPGFVDGIVTVETLLLHVSGEWVSGVTGAPAVKQDPQGVGSAITYLRRYSLAALCCIAQEDDDGHAASTPRKAPARKSAGEPPSEEQWNLIAKLTKSHVFSVSERDGIAAALEEDNTKVRAKKIIDWLTREAKARKEAEKNGGQQYEEEAGVRG